MNIAIETQHVSKRYGSRWALQDCTFALPTGKVAALVGPNGAGKTTLLHLLIGLLHATSGRVCTFGHAPQKNLARIGFVAQAHPLYRGFTVADTLQLGQHTNSQWDMDFARARMIHLHIPLQRRVSELSGGQQAQVALALALGKRPDLLLLDEPVASLDPLARREFLQTLMDAVAESGMTVLLSSHLIGDLERVCDYLIILSAARVHLVGDIEDVLASHKRLIGPREHEDALAHLHTIIESRHSGRQAILLMRTNGPILDPVWDVYPVTLEDIVLAYLQQATQQSETAADEYVQPRKEGVS